MTETLWICLNCSLAQPQSGDGFTPCYVASKTAPGHEGHTILVQGLGGVLVPGEPADWTPDALHPRCNLFRYKGPTPTWLTYATEQATGRTVGDDLPLADALIGLAWTLDKAGNGELAARFKAATDKAAAKALLRDEAIRDAIRLASNGVFGTEAGLAALAAWGTEREARAEMAQGKAAGDDQAR